MPSSRDRSSEKLAQIDRLFHDGQLEPDYYIRLQKGLMKEKPQNEKSESPVKPRKGPHLLLVEKSLISKKVRTFLAD